MDDVTLPNVTARQSAEMAPSGENRTDYFYIGGKRTAPLTGDTVEVISPHSGLPIGSVPLACEKDMDAAVAAARQAFESPAWGGLSVDQRLALVERFAEVYERMAEEFAAAMTAEMGCPASIVRMLHIDPAIRALRYYLSLGRDYPFEEQRKVVRQTLVVREPVGVVAAIIPWNGPVFLTMLKLAPALVSGCTMVLKASPEAPLSSYVLVRAAEEAGLPDGVLNVVTADRAASEYLVRHPDVDKISFTGSTAAGQRIAELCGTQLKRYNLELGGKSAAIVLDDADIGAMADMLKLGSFANSGQVCTARTRILVPWKRYDEVVDALATMAAGLRVGDPTDPATQIGPLVSRRQRDSVLNYIRIGVAEGARLVTGGTAPPDLEGGCYVQPTIFADVSNDMRIAREEIFGPVVVVIGYDDLDEAIRIANDTPFGLSGSVFTADLERGLAVARRVRSGTFGINNFGADIGAPFGGMKLSGIGREMGPEGLEDYFEYRSILLPPVPAAPVPQTAE